MILAFSRKDNFLWHTSTFIRSLSSVWNVLFFSSHLTIVSSEVAFQRARLLEVLVGSNDISSGSSPSACDAVGSVGGKQRHLLWNSP